MYEGPPSHLPTLLKCNDVTTSQVLTHPHCTAFLLDPNRDDLHPLLVPDLPRLNDIHGRHRRTRHTPAATRVCGVGTHAPHAPLLVVEEVHGVHPIILPLVHGVSRRGRPALGVLAHEVRTIVSRCAEGHHLRSCRSSYRRRRSRRSNRSSSRRSRRSSECRALSVVGRCEGAERGVACGNEGIVLGVGQGDGHVGKGRWLVTEGVFGNR